MPSLLLVKHALPAIDPGLPAPDWPLAAEGRRRAARLATRLAPYGAVCIVSSPEPKARETAHIIADHLRLPVQELAGLREHERRYTGFLNQEAFEAAVKQALRNPDQLVIGEETARQARDRFATAIDGLLAADLDASLIVVSHGTVISLFVAGLTGTDPAPLWRRLGLPSYVVLSRPDLALVDVVDSTE